MRAVAHWSLILCIFLQPASSRTGYGQAAQSLPQDPITGTIWVNSIGMKLVYCPAGECMMGSPPEELMRQEEETQHSVRISSPFYLGTTEVTQKQWSSLMDINRSLEKGEDLPVQNVSWKEALDFCRNLGIPEERVYRLPSEAEWEYACRASSQDAWWAGKDLADLAWYSENSEESSHAVGGKKPNPWGLFDLLGNVAEWCSDYYAPYPREALVDPRGPLVGKVRVIRGGSWRHFRPMLRPAARSSAPESYQYPHLGFRVTLEIPSKGSK